MYVGVWWGRRDGWTSWNSPCVLQDIGPLRPLPKRVIWTREWWFLVADTQLNTLQCQSVGRLVGVLVGLSHFWISGGFCITVLLLPNRLRLSCYVSSLVFGGWCIDAIAWFTEKLMFYGVNVFLQYACWFPETYSALFKSISAVLVPNA